MMVYKEDIVNYTSGPECSQFFFSLVPKCPLSLAKDLGFQLLSDDIDITMPVTNVQPDDHKLEELVVREVYQTFKEW